MADLNSLVKEAERVKDEMKSLLAGKSAQEIIDIKKSNDGYKDSLKLLKEINSQISDQKQQLKESVETYKQSEQSLKSLSGLQKGLVNSERQRLEMQNQLSDLNPKSIAAFNKISELNFDLAKLSAEDVISREGISKELDDMIGRMTNLSAAEELILGRLVEQRQQAEGIASLTESQQEQLEAQLETYDGIKKTLGGILDTAAIITSGPAGLLGMSLIGAGKFIGKLGEVRGELGGIAEFGTTALAFFDDNAVANAKELASQFGGINNVSGELQAATSLISVNMGISGVETAALIGSFARLNSNSQETALNLTKASQEFAAQNGLIPGALMADLAENTEAFALFGKDGGKNMIQAAGAAAKMGVSLKTMTGLADNLLDFESSISQEMELGAMLGKNINLDRARALAYQGDIAGATEETLKALGGVDAFNQMDYFSKKKTAELMGTSVEELQKMVTQQENAATLGGKINASFSLLGEGINAGLNKYLGTSLEALGGMVMAGAQLGGSFAQMGFDVKGMASKIPIIGKLFKGGATPLESISEKAGQAGGAGDKVGGAGEKAGGGLKSIADGLKEMGNTKVLFGALNLLPTALGLVAMVVGIPSLMAIAALGTSAGLGLEFIGVGLQAMGTGAAFVGALTLTAAAIGFTAMTAGIVGLAGVALLGAAAGTGLSALGIGLASFGATAGTVGWLGVAVILALSGAFVAFGYGLNLMTPAIQAIGDAIVGIINSISTGINSIISGIATMMTTLLPLFTMENATALLAMAGGFAALSLSLMSFAATSLLAIPGMIAVGAFIAVGGGSVLGGGEEGGASGGGSMDELIAEIKGLRADLASGKIGVNMDGQKVTARISSVVDKSSTNAYAK